MPIGELEAFWEAREETGAEYSVLKGTEYMRRKRGLSDGPVHDEEASEGFAQGATKRAKAAVTATPQRKKRKPQGGEGASRAQPRRRKRVKAKQGAGERVGSKRKRQGQVAQNTAQEAVGGEAGPRRKTRKVAEATQTEQQHGDRTGAEALGNSTMKAID